MHLSQSIHPRNKYRVIERELVRIQKTQDLILALILNNIWDLGQISVVET